jgi:RNA recognition motif-containing protein
LGAYIEGLIRDIYELPMKAEGSESVNRLKVFVGNLAFSATEADISELFSQYGEVIGVNLRTDRATGKKKGFGFVTFSESSSAQAAIAAANGAMFQGRALTVNVADERGKTKGQQQSPSWVTSSRPGDGKKSWTEWS